jgi:polysaccharide biosynthesis/export protein
MKNKLYLNKLLILPVLITILFTSCINRKQIAYFQNENNQPDTIAAAQAYIPKIQPGDILGIYVSSLNPAASSFFNPFAGATNGADNSVASAGMTPNGPSPAAPSAIGFLVDDAGIIDYPIIGAIKLGGLTTTQARDMIKEHLKTYVKEPTVNVRFLNYKISVIGEVTRPSQYVIPNEKVTLPEALSLAGDLTIFARRDNILIIRDNNGKKEFGRVDLNSREVFTSPYYYLHSGDLVYVEQGKGKFGQTDNVYRILPIIISALTLITLAFYRFDNR